VEDGEGAHGVRRNEEVEGGADGGANDRERAVPRALLGQRRVADGGGGFLAAALRGGVSAEASGHELRRRQGPRRGGGGLAVGGRGGGGPPRGHSVDDGAPDRMVWPRQWRLQRVGRRKRGQWQGATVRRNGGAAAGAAYTQRGGADKGRHGGQNGSDWGRERRETTPGGGQDARKRHTKSVDESQWEAEGGWRRWRGGARATSAWTP